MDGCQQLDIAVPFVFLPRYRGVQLFDSVDELAIPLFEVGSENDPPAVCNKRLLRLGTQSLSSLMPAVNLAERASRSAVRFVKGGCVIVSRNSRSKNAPNAGSFSKSGSGACLGASITMRCSVRTRSTSDPPTTSSTQAFGSTTEGDPPVLPSLTRFRSYSTTMPVYPNLAPYCNKLQHLAHTQTGFRPLGLAA